MATLTTDISFSERKQGVLKRLVLALQRGFEAHARAASRRDAIEALDAKTDHELAQMGLRREDIAHHVFRDLYYI